MVVTAITILEDLNVTAMMVGMDSCVKMISMNVLLSHVKMVLLALTHLVDSNVIVPALGILDQFVIKINV